MAARHGEVTHITAVDALTRLSAIEKPLTFQVFDDAGPTEDILELFRREDDEGFSVRSLVQSSTALNASISPVNASLYDRICRHPGDDELSDIATLSSLGEAMSWDRVGRPHQPDISSTPAGYTYFGQFIAHEVSRLLQPDVGGAMNLRSATLDLDSVFGAMDTTTAQSPDVMTLAGLGIGPLFSHIPRFDDIPRSAAGCPVLPDSRNDDHLALSQTHVAMIKLHQAIASEFCNLSPEEQCAVTIQCFQSAVLSDFLERVVDADIYRDVMDNGRSVVRPDGRFVDFPFLLPIEFTSACFRFGHSMVRDSYPEWNPCNNGSPQAFWENSSRGDGLNGGRLDHSWVNDWSRLLDFRGTALESEQKGETIKAASIDTHIAVQMTEIPREFLPRNQSSHVLGSRNIAARTLLRGHSLRIPNAYEVISTVNDLLTSNGKAPVKVIAPDELSNNENDYVKLCLDRRSSELALNAPLWFYILKEAGLKKQGFGSGEKLGPLGSRIVMETLHAAIEASKCSVMARNVIPESLRKRLGAKPSLAALVAISLGNGFSPFDC